MRTDEIKELIGEDLIKFAARHNYSAKVIRCLAGEEDKSAMSKSIQGKADKRTKGDYHKNVALGWIVEDYLIDISKGKLSHYGCDAERQFLEKDITNVGDLVDDKGNIFEVVADFTGLKYGSLPLRHNKLPHLRKANANIIIVDVINKRVFVKAAKDFPYFKVDSFKPFGGKPAYKIFLNEDIHRFKPIREVGSLVA